MGFRFSKRITIIPGVRLNISGNGVSTSIGPRGLSMTMGRNGTYLNAGLPGTGLSYRQRLDANRPGHAAAAVAIKIMVQDDGSLQITDEDGNALPPALVRRTRAEQALAIEQLLETAAEKFNQGMDACLGIHLATPGPGATPVLPAPFAECPPNAPETVESGLMDRLFRAGKLEGERLAALARHQQALADWTVARDAHEREREALQKAFKLAAKGFSAHMDKALDYVLSGIAWPKQTAVTYEFSHDVTGVALDVDLPDEDQIPQRTAHAGGNGKLSFKKRSHAQVRRDFVALCYGSLFRVVGEVFALLPAIHNCLVSGYVQRTDPTTGRLEETYILSILVTRAQWARLDFSRLERIDPAATLNSFGARVSLDRAARFGAIEPFDMTMLG